MTISEAILTLNANVVFACERAGFDSATARMVEDALDTIEDAMKAHEPKREMPIHSAWIGDETCDAYDIVGVKTWAVKRKCKVCGFTHKFIEAHMCYAYCPGCGAKMDGERRDDDA
jgi:hypothetical protein